MMVLLLLRILSIILKATGIKCFALHANKRQHTVLSIAIQMLKQPESLMPKTMFNLIKNCNNNLIKILGFGEKDGGAPIKK